MGDPLIGINQAPRACSAFQERSKEEEKAVDVSIISKETWMGCSGISLYLVAVDVRLRGAGEHMM